jgi:ATP-dependent helicase/DNAse subunit B
VLWIDERAEADEATTPLTFGTLAHEILHKFYRAFDGNYPSSLDAAAAAAYERVVDAVLRSAEERARAGEGWLGLPPLWAVSRESLRRRVREYLEWELPHMAEKGERPLEFELSFGYPEPPAEIAGTDLDGRSRVMRLSGRIDRIDRIGSGDESCYHILDYKSSSIPRRSGYEDGGVLQVPLYMEVLARRDGQNVAAGRYRAIKKPGDPQNGALVRYGDERFRSALRIALTLPDRVRRGRFEAVAAKSTGWPFYLPGRDVCRTEAVGDGSRFDV